jgi:predicted HAD superfamily phosphohydrolase YqeG
LLQIVNDILAGNLSNYDVSAVKWIENTYRLRTWKIRMLFMCKDWVYKMIWVDTRWNIYKWY